MAYGQAEPGAYGGILAEIGPCDRLCACQKSFLKKGTNVKSHLGHGEHMYRLHQNNNY